MNKEKMLEIINDVITERVTQLMEEMSTNEFVEMISEKIHTELGVDIENEENLEEIHGLIGDRVIPLFTKVTEYIIGVDLPKV